MDIITLLEILANTTHTININDLISSQPEEIKQAFLSKNTTRFRNSLGNTKNLADKSGVTYITN